MVRASSMGFRQMRLTNAGMMQRMLNVESGRAGIQPPNPSQRDNQSPNTRILHPAQPLNRECCTL
jgi:hypothetical protein